MESNLSSHWHGLLQSVKPHIPSIDSDSSASDNEEDISIFHRPDFSLSNGTRDEIEYGKETSCLLESLSSDAEVKAPIEDTSCNQGKYTDVMESTDIAQLPGDVEIDTCANSTSEIEVDEVNIIGEQHSGTPKAEEGFTLPFTLLDHLDLDELCLRDNGPSVGASVSHHPLHTTYADGDSENAQWDLMERLVTFSKQQSSGDELKAASQSELNQSCFTSRRNSAWRESHERMTSEMQLSQQEPPTVFIDLRCPGPEVQLPRTHLRVSSESKKPNSCNLHKEDPLVKSATLRSSCGRGDATGKSVLLQKLSERRRSRKEGPKKCTQSHDSLWGNQREEEREKPPKPLATGSQVQPFAEDILSSSVSCEYSKPKAERTSNQPGTIEHPKLPSCQYKRQQKDQTLHSIQHQHLLKQLERHRPNTSVSGRHPAAHITDVLYDVEASYLQPINNLPSDLKHKSCVLLTVALSSCGTTAGNSHGKTQKLESAVTKSHIYNSLVACFFSLVGPGSRNEGTTGSDVPFWVAGLEQLWTDNGLALHVLAVSHAETTQYLSQIQKVNVDSQNAFHQHVCRFLSQTSLRGIAHWLPQLKGLLDNQSYPSAVHLPPSHLNTFISVSSDQTRIGQIFGHSPGFYWQTLETEEPRCQKVDDMDIQHLHTEVTVAVGFKAFFLHPLATHHTLHLLLDAGLDVCGLRLLYPPSALLADLTGCVSNIQGSDGACQPVLAMAVRGPYARSVWQDITGPSDPLLARRTDPASINAIHCSSKDLPLFHSPRHEGLVHLELCMWFGGRLQRENSQNLNHPLNDRVGSQCDPVESGQTYQTRSPATLCATTQADVFLVVSPAVSPCCYSLVLSVCECRGFSLAGLQRCQLGTKWAQVLGLSRQQASVFCSCPSPGLDQEKVGLFSHSLVLLLRRENVLHHCASLPAALMKELATHKLLGSVHLSQSADAQKDSRCCFHILPYSDSLPSSFGKCLWAVPEPSSAVLTNQRCPSNPELEQVVILTLSGKDMSQGLKLLHRALTGLPEAVDVGNSRHELLALKWLPSLTWRQAQELSPYEVGDQHWNASLSRLATSPALVCALRRTGAFAELRQLLPCDYPGDLSVLMSPTPDLALRQATVFFTETDMIPDNSARPLLKFLPPSFNTNGSKRGSLSHIMVQDPQPLLTLCLFKPGVWNRSLGKILRRIHKNGFTVVGLRVLVLDRTTALLLMSPEKVTSDFEDHVHYLCFGSSLALCLQRENAVKTLLDLLGPGDQAKDHVQDQCLWRSIYVTEHVHSGVYGSDSYQRAVCDVKRLFPDGTCCTETLTMRQAGVFSIHSDPLACLAREQTHTLTSVAKERTAFVIGSGQNGVPGSLIHNAVCQTTCLLVPSNALQPCQVPTYVDLLEQLLRAGCHLVAGRMTVLDKAQMQHIAETLALSAKSDGTMPNLHGGSCLILALQSECVVSCFDTVLESIYRWRADLIKVADQIIYPRTVEQAKNLLCYLFDALSPESLQYIVSRGSSA